MTHLSLAASKLLYSQNPNSMIQAAAKTLSKSRSIADIDATLSAVEFLGIDPLVVAAFGTPKAALRLGVSLELAKAIRTARPEYYPDSGLVIQGNLICKGTSSVCIPALRGVGGSIWVQQDQSVELDNLTRVEGSISVPTNGSFTSACLESARGLKGDEAEWIYLPALTWLGESGLWVKSCHNLELPSLEGIAGSARVTECADLDLQSLGTIDGDLTVLNSPYIVVPNLEIVHGSVEVWKDCPRSFGRLRAIVGKLSVHHAPSFHLPSLHSLFGGLIARHSNGLALPSLEQLGKSIDLTETLPTPETQRRILEAIANGWW